MAVLTRTLTWLTTIILICYAGVCCAYTPPAVVKIGAILPLTGTLNGAGNRALLLLNLSVHELASNLGSGYLNGTRIELEVADSQSTLKGALLAMNTLAGKGVVALIGATEGLNHVSDKVEVRDPSLFGGVGAGTANIAMLTWAANGQPDPFQVMAVSTSACEARGFNDRTLYPYLNRMCVRQNSRADAMLQTLIKFRWTKVAVIAQDGADGWGQNSLAQADTVGNTMGPGQGEADLLMYKIAQASSTDYVIKNTLRIRIPAVTELAIAQIPTRLQELKDSGIRIIVIYMQGDMLIRTMREAASMDMLQTPYVWIGAGANAGPASGDGLGSGTVSSGGQGIGLCSKGMRRALADLTPSVASIDSSAGQLISTYQSSSMGASSSAATYVYQADLAFTSSPLLGAICFAPAAPRTPAFTNIKYRLAERGLNFTSILNGDDAGVYDSITVYGAAIDYLIKNQVALTSNGRWPALEMWKAIRQVNLPTQGLIQDIAFDENGDRVPMVDIYNYDPYGPASGGFIRSGQWSGVTKQVTIEDTFIWSDGTTALPPDHVNKFETDQIITPTSDSSIMALAYFYVLLPALVLTYNARRMMKTFIESVGQDTDWVMDGLRGFGLFSLSGVLGMVYLNVLAFSFPTGDFDVSSRNFIGGIFLCLIAVPFIVFTPLLIETWWHARKGQHHVTELLDDFESLLDNGEEVTLATVTKKDANGKEIHTAEGTRASRRAAAKAARQKAKSGKLMRDDSQGFLEREFATVCEKFTIGLALTSAIFGALTTGIFLITIDGLMLPMSISRNEGGLFGVFLLTTVTAHCFLTAIFKDSRNMARLVSAFGLAAVEFMAFHANLACITFKYTGVNHHADDTIIDNGGIAIAHAILFAIPFFVGLLQLIKALKLSRHSLDSVLNGMKSKLASLESGLDAAKNERKQAAVDADHLKRLLELSNLCRPLHRNHALAFTMAETTNTGASDATMQMSNKIFVPASLQQEATRTTGNNGRSNGINGSPTPANRALSKTGGGTQPATPTLNGDSATTPSVRGIDASPSPTGATPPNGNNRPVSKAPPKFALPPPAQGNVSVGIASAANNITGLDFGFLARPKAEMTGYKLLNELSLELFLASGPVHHRAVADIHLSHILGHPLTLEVFKDSLTRTGSQETLAFWLDIQRFKQIEDETLRRQIAEQMLSTFVYSDAPYPLNFLTPASREGALNVIFAKKSVKSTTFHFIEQELLGQIQKDFANFVTSTGFKVCAFLLGHSSYRPSTRIKTLNPNGAAVGDGGKLVPITQVNAGPMSAGGEHSAGSNANTDDPQSSVAGQSTVLRGGVGSVVGRGVGGMHGKPAADSPKGVTGARTTGLGVGAGGPTSKSGLSPQPIGRRTTVENAKSVAAAAGAASVDKSLGDPLDATIQPQLARNPSEPLLTEDANDPEDEDGEETPLAPTGMMMLSNADTDK